MKRSMISSHCFIIGAPKCGTTSVAHWLDQNPDVCMSRPKESKFFTSEYSPWGWEADYIRKNFSHFDGEKVICDANPMLMLAPFFAERIAIEMERHEIDSPKFVAILREPISRAYSHWKMDHNMVPGRTYRSFERAIQKNMEIFDYRNFEFEGELPFNNLGGLMTTAYIEYGLYYNQIKNFVNLFGKDSMLIVDFEDLKKNEIDVYDRICDHLGIWPFNVHMNIKKIGNGKSFDWEEIYKEHPIIQNYFDKMTRIYRGQAIQLDKMFETNLERTWNYG